METINIHAAKTHLSRLIERAIKGEDIVISRNGEPLVHLTPYENKARKQDRHGGQWTGKISYAPGFEGADTLIEKSLREGLLYPED